MRLTQLEEIRQMFLSSSEPPADEETILDAIREAQAGDEESFTALYHWYYAQIYRHLLRLVGNAEDAADLSQETFSKAWRGLVGVHDGRRFRGWLYKIATNAAMDHLRRKMRGRGFWSSPDAACSEEPAINFDCQVEEQELVQLALSQVAPKPRVCLLLQLEGFSQAEIATLVGLQKKSVGTYVCTAREQFRQAYRKLENR